MPRCVRNSRDATARLARFPDGQVRVLALLPERLGAMPGGVDVLVVVGFAGERVSVVRSPEPAGREVLLGVRSRAGGGRAALV